MAGSLRQRGKTSWQLRVLAGRGYITGKKSYFSKTFRGGRREAERELARLVAEGLQSPLRISKRSSMASSTTSASSTLRPSFTPCRPASSGAGGRRVRGCSRAIA